MKLECLLFLSCILVRTLAQEIKEISVGDYLELSYDPAGPDKALYYKLTLKESDIKANEQIAVFVRPLDYKSDPDIFISTIKKYPSIDDNEIKCEIYGFDVCYLPEVYLKADQSFYLAFNCENTCKFSVQIDLKIPELIEFEKTQLVKLEKNSENILHFHVPNLPALENFRILLKFDGIQSKEPTAWICKGNKPADTRWDQDALPIFYAPFGYIFLASKTYYPTGFCINCNYTISIEVEDETSLWIKSFPDDQIQNIGLFEQVYDGVTWRSFQAYILDTTTKSADAKTLVQWGTDNRINDTIIFQMQVYQGDPDLYINCDAMPRELDTYQWKSTYFKSEGIIIGPDDFGQLAPESCKNIYAVVYGRSWGVFEFEARKINQQLINSLNAGEYQLGALNKGDIQNFIFIVKKSEIERNTSIVIDLAALKGNPDLYIKGCSNLADCEITKEDIESATELSKDASTFFRYSVTIESEHYEFAITEENCLSNEIHPMCFYVFGVHAGKTAIENTQTKYSIIALLKNGIVQLLENVPQKFYLPLYTWKHFTFQILDSTDIIQINFQLTFIYGEADLAISRTIKRPVFRNADKVGCYCVNMVNYTKSIDGDLTGNYYIGVYSIAECMFTINTFIVREEGSTEQLQTVTLLNGVPQKIVQNNFTMETYFIFKVDDLTKSIELKLQIEKGSHFKMFLKNVQTITKNSSASDQDSDFKTGQTSLIIAANSYKYKYFLLTVLFKGKLEKAEDNYQYIVKFETHEKVLTLYPNVIQSTHLIPQYPQYYKVEVLEDDVTIYLSLSSEFSGARMELSNDLEFEKDEPPSTVEHVPGHHSASKLITLTETEIKSFCSFEEEKCTIYVKLFTMNSFETQVLLLMEKLQKSNEDQKVKFPAVGVLEGMMLELSLSEQWQRHFYLYAKDIERTYFVQFLTTDAIIDVNYTIISQRTKTHGQGLLDGLFLDIESKEYAEEKVHKFTWIRKIKVAKQEFLDADCDIDCMILFTVRTQKMFSPESSVPKTMTIQVVTESQNIFVGELVHGTLQQGESNFYQFENKVCPSLLTVSLDINKQDSDADLYVTKGIYYDQDKSQVYSSTEDGLHDSVTIKNCECGPYTIEVIGKSQRDTEYSVQVSSYKNIQLFKLLTGQNFIQHSLAEEVEIYLYYIKQTGAQLLSLLIERYYGDAEVTVLRVGELIAEEEQFNDSCTWENCMFIGFDSGTTFYNFNLPEYKNLWNSSEDSVYIIRLQLEKYSQIGVRMVEVNDLGVMYGILEDDEIQFIQFSGNEDFKEKTYEYRINDYTKDLRVELDVINGYEFFEYLIVIAVPIGQNEKEDSYILKHEYPGKEMNFVIDKKDLQKKESLLFKLIQKPDKENLGVKLKMAVHKMENEKKGVMLLEGIFTNGLLKNVQDSIQYYFTDQYKEQPNKYSIAIFTKGLGIENVEMLLKFIRITIQSKCVKCEKGVNGFNITIGQEDQRANNIHGGEDKFYIEFEGSHHGIFRYTIQLDYIHWIQNKESFSFNIIHNHQNIILLPQDYAYRGELFIKNQDMNQTFYLYVEQKGTLIIQFDRCWGNFELRGATSYHSLEKKHSHKNFKMHYYSSQNGKQIAKQQVSAGIYYIAVVAVSAPTKDLTQELGQYFVFRIQAKIINYEVEKLPQFYLQAGNEGKLDYQFNKETLKLKINSLDFTSEDSLKQFSDYQCKFTHQTFLNYEWFNHAIYTSEIKISKEHQEVAYEVGIEKLAKDLSIGKQELKKVYVSATILAAFNGIDIQAIKNKLLDLEISGNAVEIDYKQEFISIEQEKKSNYSAALKIILILGAILIIIIGIVLWRRYKLIKKNLNQLPEEPELQMANP